MSVCRWVIRKNFNRNLLFYFNFFLMRTSSGILIGLFNLSFNKGIVGCGVGWNDCFVVCDGSVIVDFLCIFFVLVNKFVNFF